MNKQILIDVDGVLLDWLETFVEHMKEIGYTQLVDEPSQYNLGHLFGISKDEVYKRITEFNDGHWRFGTLRPCEGAKEAMRILSWMGYSFIAITSCSDQDHVASLRRANLYNAFGGVFDEVHCIGIHQNKRPILESYPQSFWIEDRFSHAVEGAEAGHKAIVIQRSWNVGEEHDGVKICQNWGEIVNYILNENNS